MLSVSWHIKLDSIKMFSMLNVLLRVLIKQTALKLRNDVCLYTACAMICSQFQKN